MQDWARLENNEAHWIKLRYPMYLVAACGKSLPTTARRVYTTKMALAQAPGKFIETPEGLACAACQKKAIEQA